MYVEKRPAQLNKNEQNKITFQTLQTWFSYKHFQFQPDHQLPVFL